MYCISGIRDDLDVEEVPHNQMAESLSSHQYKSFMVKLLRKLPIKQEQDVQIGQCCLLCLFPIRSFYANHGYFLGITGEKIEIDPLAANKTVLFKQKAATYIMEDIAACLLLEEKSSGESDSSLGLILPSLSIYFMTCRQRHIPACLPARAWFQAPWLRVWFSCSQRNCHKGQQYSGAAFQSCAQRLQDASGEKTQQTPYFWFLTNHCFLFLCCLWRCWASVDDVRLMYWFIVSVY